MSEPTRRVYFSDVDIARVMRDYSTLGRNGFWYPHQQTSSLTLAEDRARLEASVEDIAFAIEWLRQFATTKRITDNSPSSYYLKHVAEPFSSRGYIANGDMIAAVIHLGLPWKRYCFRSPNISVGLSKRSIAEFLKSNREQLSKHCIYVPSESEKAYRARMSRGGVTRWRRSPYGRF